MMEVSLHILVWNDLPDLPYLLASLRTLVRPGLTVRMLDNGSTDGSREYLHMHVPEWLVACNARNEGFASGHNQLIRIALRRWGGAALADKAIILVNADMILDPGVIQALLAPLEADASLGATQPKLFRAFRPQEAWEDPVRSTILDTTGLVMRANWRMEDRGAGEEDVGQYDSETRLLGVAGAMPCYRASALVDAREGDDVFDGDFFAYREDCDLALRLLRLGWKAQFVPQAHAWHYRGMFGAARRTWRERLRDRRGQAAWRCAHSMRNQIFFLMKQFPVYAGIRYLPRVFWGEFFRLGYSIVFEPATRKLLLASLTIVPKMYKKRSEIIRRSRLSWKEVFSYVSH